MITTDNAGYESIDWQEINRRFRAGRLRAKLMRLALTLTAIAIILLTINLFALFWLRGNVESLVRTRAPLVEASRTAQLGMQRSLASLRGWVAIGDPEFKEHHDATWHNEILPAVERINGLLEGTAKDEDMEFKRSLADIGTRLEDLWVSHWWVADVARTPGNQPARVEYQLRVVPAKRNVERSLYEIMTPLAEEEDLMVTQTSLAFLALFQQHFALADAALHDAIDFGHDTAIDEFEYNIEIAQGYQAARDPFDESFSSLQLEHFANIAQEFTWYTHHARHAIELRSGDQWNVAQHLMATETAPLTRALSANLDSMAEQQATLMRRESDYLHSAANSLLILSILLIVLMAAIAYVVTHRRARQITRPVDRLSVATMKLAEGTLSDDLPVTTNDELGKLTFAFNSMRANLQKADESLRGANEHMRNELEAAADYARSILPQPINDKERGIRSDWKFIESSELGGDSLGYHWLDDEHLAVYLLDVSGHGVGPSILSVSAHNALRQQTLPATDFHQPVQVLEALNRAFPMHANQNKFFTIWYGVYNWKTREIRYASAGHHAAVLFDPSHTEPVELEMHGLMIGVMTDAEYESAVTTIGPGSRLYLFSDGTFEMRNRDDVILDMPGFIEHLRDVQMKDDRLQAVLEKARRWQGSDDFVDDYSILEISFAGPE